MSINIILMEYHNTVKCEFLLYTCDLGGEFGEFMCLKTEILQMNLQYEAGYEDHQVTNCLTKCDSFLIPV